MGATTITFIEIRGLDDFRKIVKLYVNVGERILDTSNLASPLLIRNINRHKSAVN